MEGEKGLKKMGRFIMALLALDPAWLFFMPLRPASAQTTSAVTEEMAGENDHFQATQWLRLAGQFWETGDYPQMAHFCRLVLTYYPDTDYAKEAQKLLKKTANPSVNRAREYRRNNPALFFH